MTVNLTRIISIKERIAKISDFKPDERDFILECINIALEETMKAPPAMPLDPLVERDQWLELFEFLKAQSIRHGMPAGEAEERAQTIVRKLIQAIGFRERR